MQGPAESSSTIGSVGANTSVEIPGCSSLSHVKQGNSFCDTFILGNNDYNMNRHYVNCLQNFRSEKEKDIIHIEGHCVTKKVYKIFVLTENAFI